jgi:hypothetical protein
MDDVCAGEVITPDKTDKGHRNKKVKNKSTIKPVNNNQNENKHNSADNFDEKVSCNRSNNGYIVFTRRKRTT